MQPRHTVQIWRKGDVASPGSWQGKCAQEREGQNVHCHFVDMLSRM